MNCNNIEKEILTGDRSTGSAEKHHLSECRECRQFAQLVSLLTPPVAPTAELDRQVLTTITMIMRRQRLTRLFRNVAAVAAVLALAAVSWTLYLRPAPNQPTIAAAATQELLQTEHWMVAWADTDSEIDNLELQLAVVTAGL